MTTRRHAKWLTLFTTCLLAVSNCPAQTMDIAELERRSKQGKTLSAEVTAQFPLREQRVRNDTGINVLVDLAHQASFLTMWSLPGELRRHGVFASGFCQTFRIMQKPSLCWGWPCLTWVGRTRLLGSCSERRH